MTTLAQRTAIAEPPARTVQAPSAPYAEPVDDRRLWQKVYHARPGDPVWVRPALVVLLVGTALLYLWNLSSSGWANSFYSAAAQAGSVSWKAMFFGASDSAGSITVDKPPLSIWAMALSVRLLGLSSFSILLPQALMGVASVGMLYATVRRWTGPAAGLVAGATLALTPIAVLMFRFNNPDAMLVLLLVLAAYATVRAIEGASTRWLLLVGALVGLAFLTKMMQAFLVVPGFALAYLIAADTPVRRRLLQLVAAGAAMVVAGGWWVAVVELWPAGSRPYIGGSQNNSIVDLILSYNGFGRLTGDETGSVTGGGGFGGSMWGQTGITRLFTSSWGGQASWLLPTALILIVGLGWATGRRPRTDRVRAATIIWGGWLLVTWLTFSYMAGIVHEYYSVALAPAIGALVGIGGVELWRRRHDIVARLFLSAAVAVTAWWAWVLLGRSAQFVPWLRTPVLVVGVVAAVGILFWDRLSTTLAAAVGAVVLVAALAGPASYAAQTASTGHSGSIVSAGPAVAGGRGFGGFGGGFGGRGGPGGMPGGTGQNGTVPQGGTGATSPTGGMGQGGGFGGAGGLLGSSTVSTQMQALLEADADSFTWVAATIGSNAASGYQLATQLPVMPIGGFNGSDPSPTLAQFQQYVTEGRIHYFISSGVSGRSNGGSDAAQQISAWVQANFTSTTVDGVTVYDLTSPTASG